MNTTRAAGCLSLAAVLFLFILSTTANAGDIAQNWFCGAAQPCRTCDYCHYEGQEKIPTTSNPNARFELHIWVEVIAFVIGIIAAIVITLSVIISLAQRFGHMLYWRKELESDRKKRESKIRIRFAEGVSVALGLLIASEILSSIGAPSLNKLYLIAFTVIIRALVGLIVFLEEKKEDRQNSTAGA